MDSIEDRIRFRIKDLHRLELYFYSDNRSLEFFKENPDNIEELIVSEKLSAINSGLIDTSDLHALARHIISLPVDEALARHDTEIVKKMAGIESRSGHAALLHFCSLYCNYHHPEVYAVQSPNSVEILQLLQGKTASESFRELDLTRYEEFRKALDIVRERYGLEEMDYHHLDKFLWINASRIHEVIRDV